MSGGTEYAQRLVEVEKENERLRAEIAGAQDGWRRCAVDLASETARANAAEERSEDLARRLQAQRAATASLIGGVEAPDLVGRALSPVESPGEEGAWPADRLAGWIEGARTAYQERGMDVDAAAAKAEWLRSQVETSRTDPIYLWEQDRAAPAAAESTRADLDDLITRYGEAVQQQAIHAATGDPALIRAVRDARNDIRSAFAAAPREMEKVRGVVEASRALARDVYGLAHGLVTQYVVECSAAKVERALARLSSAAGESPERGDGLAPWYEADGSTVMLPAEEVERRRKLAAKVLDAARNLLDRRNLDGSLTVTRKFCDPLDRAIRDLDARPSPRGTGTDTEDPT